MLMTLTQVLDHDQIWPKGPLDMLLIVLVTHRCMCILMSYKTVLMLGSFPTLVLSSPLFGQAPSAYARNLCCMSNYWTYNVPPRQLSWSITTITRIYGRYNYSTIVSGLYRLTYNWGDTTLYY
jgi:hypothetical protein